MLDGLSRAYARAWTRAIVTPDVRVNRAYMDFRESAGVGSYCVVS